MDRDGRADEDGLIKLEDGKPSDGDSGHGPGLTYPFETVPRAGEALCVADGILWLRLPLPFSLDHINVWALWGGQDLVLVDTGLGTPVTEQVWTQVLAGPLYGWPVTRVIATHMHPDHVGMAGWLCDRFDAPLMMTPLEYLTARILSTDQGPAPEVGARFYHQAGWSQDEIDTWRKGYGLFGRGVRPLPKSFERLVDGQELCLAGQTWTVVTGNGHSPDHACLWRRADNVLISGDQLLPKISSNVSVWPTEPRANPLSDWLSSLNKLENTFDDDTLVLPAHGLPFYGLTQRVSALKRGHQRQLTRLRQALMAKPLSVRQMFDTLFFKTISASELGLATGETLANLHHLEGLGQVRQTLDSDGVFHWQSQSFEPVDLKG